ncbi:response regulator receiver protein [Candidatus Magnetomorum sp. HK-1]|nr:response regulator receiver protein [Candidatus Magnetomorum sp. HK-1]
MDKKIILIDDEESILYSFHKFFSDEGYNVTFCSSGKEGIANLQKSHFDLAIIDLIMPDLEGTLVLKEAKKINSEIGAIILTGYGDMNSAIEALRLGADDYLLKPCDTDELLIRAERCIEKYEALRKIKLYEEILPVCMYCKSFRDDSGTEKGKGKWLSMEDYLLIKKGTSVSHGCCPDCFEKHKD